MYILTAYLKLVQFQSLQTLARGTMNTLTTNSSQLGIAANES